MPNGEHSKRDRFNQPTNLEQWLEVLKAKQSTLGKPHEELDKWIETVSNFLETEMEIPERTKEALLTRANDLNGEIK